MNIQDEVRKIIAESLNIDSEILSNDIKLIDDLEVDSIAFIQLVVEAEDEFGIEFPDDKLDFSSFITVADIESTILKLIDEKMS